MILPHNIGIEQLVLGALINNNNLFDLVCNILNEGDFFHSGYGKIYEAIKQKLSQGYLANFLTLAEVFAHGGFKESDITSFQNMIIADADIIKYAKTLRDYSIRRHLIQTGKNMMEMAQNSENIMEQLTSLESAIFQLGESTLQKNTDSFVSISKIFLDKTAAMLKSNQKIHGVTSGFLSLDKITGGFRKGELIILAGRPSVGKTAFATNMAVEACLKQEKKVLFISLEMPGEQICARVLSYLSKVPLNLLLHATLSSNHLQHCNKVLKQYGKMPLIIHDSSFMTISSLQSLLRQLKRQENIDIVFIDYLQLMDAGIKTDNREQEISRISRSLKLIAKDMGVPIVSLSQLSRDVEKRKENNAPKLSDLRGSGSIEQDADVILFLYREDENNKTTVNLKIAKNRNGELGDILLNYDGMTTTFFE